MCLGTFGRLARSLATCFCFARVRILAERLLFHRTKFPMKQQKNPGNLTVPGYLLRLDTMRFLEATLYYIYTVHLLACCAYKKHLCLIH